MLPQRPPVLNGYVLSHAELRALHEVRSRAIHEATARYCTDGPRLLDWLGGERYVMKAHGRDAKGLLLASVTISLPHHGHTYTRKVRLVRWADSDVKLKVEVAREQRRMYS